MTPAELEAASPVGQRSIRRRKCHRCRAHVLATWTADVCAFPALLHPAPTTEQGVVAAVILGGRVVDVHRDPLGRLVAAELGRGHARAGDLFVTHACGVAFPEATSVLTPNPTSNPTPTGGLFDECPF